MTGEAQRNGAPAGAGQGPERSESIAPASRGLKGRDPELLDDKAEKENARPASPFNAIRRTARWFRTALSGPAIFAKKNTHRRPSHQTKSDGLDGRRICTRTLG